MRMIDATVKNKLDEGLLALEEHFDADVIFYYGEIHPAIAKTFRDFVEQLQESTPQRSKVAVLLNTPGGSVEVVEKMVEIIRHHYDDVSFVVPDFAMSAGTILCMSGDRILMDYSSSLGPIDPQVFNGQEWVPALGYLDKVAEMLEKAKHDELTKAEFLILQGLDLATLSRYEQARDLTVTLLKRWLVQYKFRDWTIHETSPDKRGKPVTLEEKEARAADIAKLLGNNRLWHSHGRLISPATLRNVLKLKIDDYSEDVSLRRKVRAYNDLITQYIARENFKFFMHSRNYF